MAVRGCSAPRASVSPQPGFPVCFEQGLCWGAWHRAGLAQEGPRPLGCPLPPSVGSLQQWWLLWLPRKSYNHGKGNWSRVETSAGAGQDLGTRNKERGALCPVPCALCSVPCALWLVPCALSPVPSTLSPALLHVGLCPLRNLAELPQFHPQTCCG